MFVVLAYLAASIIPLTPLSPKPPATKMPAQSFSIDSAVLGSSFSLSTHFKFTLVSVAAPAWMRASVRLL